MLINNEAKELKEIKLQIDHYKSIGEVVVMSDHPNLGVFKGDVLIDPKINYHHPQYDAFVYTIRGKLGRLIETLEGQLL